MISLEWDSRDLAVWRARGRTLDQELLGTVKKAGSDALRDMRTTGTRFVRLKKKFKVAKVRKGLPLFFPKSKTDLVWIMKVSGEPVPVSAFPHRQTKQGVVAEINVGKRTLIKSAFVAMMASGHKGVFRRRGKTRLPIDEAFTTKISDVFNNDGLINLIQTRAQNVFSATMGRLLKTNL